MSDVSTLIQRLFNPAKYWRGRYNHEKATRIGAEIRLAEAEHVSQLRLGTILSHERSNAEMRLLLTQAHAAIGKLEDELDAMRKKKALVRDEKTGRIVRVS